MHKDKTQPPCVHARARSATSWEPERNAAKNTLNRGDEECAVDRCTDHGGELLEQFLFVLRRERDRVPHGTHQVLAIANPEVGEVQRK